MTTLRMYTSAALAEMARQVRLRRADKTMTDVDLALLLARCVLRDEAGTYFYLDPRDATWYRWDTEAWRSCDSPSGPLTGEDGLPVPVPLPQVPAEDTMVPDEPASAAQALAKIRETVHTAYREGRIDGDAAAILMARQVVVERSGIAWTVGIATGHWYRFWPESWSEAAPPPMDAELCGRGELGSLLANPSGENDPPDALARFLVAGVGVLPEAITPPWAPPDAIPAAAMKLYRVCPSCKATIAAESRFCPVCRAVRPEPLPPKGASAPEKQPEARCSRCGAPLRAGDAFCLRCGAPVSEPNHCIRCGAQIPKGARFCQLCGARQDERP